MSEAQRPHPAIPLSPPSPPADGVKEGSTSHFPDYRPDSPASPLMSVATKSYGQSFAETQPSSGPAAAQRSPSPPISAPMSTQVSQQPNIVAPTSFPTPDNSVIGQTRKVPVDFDEEHITKRQRLDDHNVLPQEEAGHNRSFPADGNAPIEPLSPTSTQKAADLADNVALRSESQKEPQDLATQPASDETSFEQLQKNLGQVFHLCKSGKIHFCFDGYKSCRKFDIDR